MIDQVPYNAGEIRKSGSTHFLICGHIWWPVEKKNAYHVLEIDPVSKDIKSDKPAYVWDYENNWQYVGVL